MTSGTCGEIFIWSSLGIFFPQNQNNQKKCPKSEIQPISKSQQIGDGVKMNKFSKFISSAKEEATCSKLCTHVGHDCR
jgi:hypothetical protein